MFTLDEGSRLDVKGVVAGCFLSNCITAGSWERVKSGFFNGSSDSSWVVSIESSWKVFEVPGNGCFSSLRLEMNGDSVIDSVDPAVKSSGDDKFNNFFILFIGSGTVGTGSDAYKVLFLSCILSVSVGNSEFESTSETGSTWKDSISWSAKEIG